METTNNELPENAKIFFTKLKNYLDTNIYYYGSIQRYDYLPENSDIDVAIFCDNEDSVISKLQYFLDKKKSSFKKFIHRLPQNGTVVYGHKIKYVAQNFTVEFALYDEKDKDIVLEEKTTKNNIPFYVAFILYILKFLHYKLGIFSYNTFFNLKKFCLNYLVEGKDAEYITL